MNSSRGEGGPPDNPTRFHYRTPSGLPAVSLWLGSASAFAVSWSAELSFGEVGFPKWAGRAAFFLHATVSEIQILARACGKRDVHDLEPEDMRALTLEASLITGLPLAGTRTVFGGGPGWKRPMS